MKKLSLNILLLLSLSILLPVKNAAAELGSEEACLNLTNQFMEAIGKGDYQAGFDLIAPHYPLPENEITQLAALTEKQMNSVATRFGKAIGSEFIRKNSLGESFLRYSYIQKLENHATRWQITFYRPKDKWIINKVSFDDSPEKLFEHRW